MLDSQRLWLYKQIPGRKGLLYQTPHYHGAPEAKKRIFMSLAPGCSWALGCMRPLRRLRLGDRLSAEVFGSSDSEVDEEGRGI